MTPQQVKELNKLLQVPIKRRLDANCIVYINNLTNNKLDEILFDIKCLIWKQTLTSQLNGEKEFEKRLYNLLNDIEQRIKLESKEE